MKTITLLKHEFDDALVALVNECGLPACVIKPSIVNLLKAVENLEEQQYERDLAEYQKEPPDNGENMEDQEIVN